MEQGVGAARGPLEFLGDLWVPSLDWTSEATLSPHGSRGAGSADLPAPLLLQAPFW